MSHPLTSEELKTALLATLEVLEDMMEILRSRGHRQDSLLLHPVHEKFQLRRSQRVRRQRFNLPA